ncbi:hypothetical protein [Nocardioides sp. GY 10127]|uniref:hypothetical protein n=1 Tax=Nocardioides sp. GY 10127 TaxID=2569762 RepID=UPI0010A8C655|nr:hypothetical protein [Nocardioides sp. GY 10127]TIC78763.1 hypothetical protein E8D37_18885 [Nocardioides sp. GY 10127]
MLAPDEIDPDLILTAEDCTLDPAAEALPTLGADDFGPPPEPEARQDDVDEGMGAVADSGPGAIPDYVRSKKDALALAVSYARDGRSVTPGYCLRETRSYFNVGSLYAAAKLSLAGAKALGVAHKVNLSDPAAVNKIPRGAIVYWWGPSSQYGHIAPSLGGGMVLSTDWPRGKYGKVRVDTLAHAWGYTEAYWAPVVNDVRVWKPVSTKPKKTPTITRALAALKGDQPKKAEALLSKLADDGDGDRPHEAKAAAKRVLRAMDLADQIDELRDEIADLTARRKAARTRGLQSLRALEVA